MNMNLVLYKNMTLILYITDPEEIYLQYLVGKLNLVFIIYSIILGINSMISSFLLHIHVQMIV